MLLKLHVLLLLLLLFFTTSSSSTTTPTKSKKKTIMTITSIPISSGRLLLHSSTYIIPTSLGSPPTPLYLSLSTTSSFSSIPFSPSSSTTFLPLLCNSSSCPLLSTPSCPSPSSPCSSFSQDTLSFTNSSSSLTFPNFTFSCTSTSTSPSPSSQPLLSLSLSPSSFISQTNSIFSSTFSYCLPFFLSTNFSGSLLLGPSSQPKHLKTMPLLINPRRPSLYYVNFTAIRLGRKLLPVRPFDSASGAGTVLDPASMYTRLSALDYAAVRDTFRKYVNGTVTSLGGFDTCYDGPVNPPAVTLVFGRLQVKLPPENVMIHSSSGSLSCLAMYGAAENDTSGLNVIGSMQHQNHRILFDVPNRRVGIAREICTVS